MVFCRIGLVIDSFLFIGLFVIGVGIIFIMWLGSCAVFLVIVRTGCGEGRTLGVWSCIIVGWESITVWFVVE